MFHSQNHADSLSGHIIGGQHQQQPPRQQHQNLNFPSKLFVLLDEAERTGFSHVISWMPHGRSFRVHERKTFVEHLMPWYVFHSLLHQSTPRCCELFPYSTQPQPCLLFYLLRSSYFGQSSYASLQRQLNIYGFSRIGKLSAIILACPVPLGRDSVNRDTHARTCLGGSMNRIRTR